MAVGLLGPTEQNPRDSAERMRDGLNIEWTRRQNSRGPQRPREPLHDRAYRNGGAHWQSPPGRVQPYRHQQHVLETRFQDSYRRINDCLGVTAVLTRGIHIRVNQEDAVSHIFWGTDGLGEPKLYFI